MKKAFARSHLFAFCALLSIPLLGLIYQYLNYDNGNVYSLSTSLDEQIPFLKIFVIPYLFWYLFIPITLIYLMFRNRKAFYQTLVQYNLGLLSCYGIYMIYQTHVPRPNLTGEDFLTQMVHFVYQSDAPFNCFPSIHILTTYLIMRAFLQTTNISAFMKITVTTFAALIIASTLLMKQHVLLDMVGAILVVETIVLATTQIGQVRWKALFQREQPQRQQTDSYKVIRRGA